MSNPIVDDARTLRLIWPQWQGAGSDVVAELLPEFPLAEARRAYPVGTRVLEAVLPAHAGPTETVPVPMGEPTPGSIDGIESRPEILASLDAALAALGRHDVDRVLTLGGECSVSVAPFTALASKYGDDLAVVWVDSHPDTDTPDTGYDGYHAMAASTITGHGDRQVLDRLPATVDPRRVALAGVHDWVDDAWAHVGQWGISSFSPDTLRDNSGQLLEWLASTGATKVAIHIDVDTVDSDELVLGLGQVPGGLTRAQVHRVVTDLAGAADVVGLTIAEFIPRQVMALQSMLKGMPLFGQ